MPTTHQYASFLVRLWREADQAEVPGQASAWQGEIEHIQSGSRHTFRDLDALADLLLKTTEGLNVVPQPHDKESD